MKKNSGEKFPATIITEKKAGYYRSRFLVPEARNVLTQIGSVAVFLKEKIGGKRSGWKLWVQSTENTTALTLHNTSRFVIALTFHSTACFEKKDEPYSVIIIRYLELRVGILKGWPRK